MVSFIRSKQKSWRERNLIFTLGKKNSFMTQDFIQLLLPEGLFEYFDLVKVEKVDYTYNIYITERNSIPKEFEGQKL
jgi:hypothetical protein